MAHPPPTSPEADLAGHVTPAAHMALQHPPIGPGKVALWLFLATEVMFFTGLIGSYIVLRAGSPAAGYSNLYPPGTDLRALTASQGLRLERPGPSPERIAETLQADGVLKGDAARHFAEAPGHTPTPGLPPARANALADKLKAAGATAQLVPLKAAKWPQPYDDATNPLSIDLTAFNTFILICSSVTMVLALSSIQRGRKGKLTLYLLATVLIGSVFLGIQVFEYRQLLWVHHYPVGVSPTGHFTPNVSLFASCFFTMTGFHGAHVAGGVVMLLGLLIRSLFGAYSRDDYAPVELVGLYWHFVDLVWIILFTVVYLI